MGVAITIALSVLTVLFLYLILIGAKLSHFISAFVEAVVVYIISNMPFIILFWSVSTKSNSDNAILVLVSLVNSGEVFIYVSAILAPVVWALIAYFREVHRGLSGAYLLMLLFIMGYSAYTFKEKRLVTDISETVIDISAMSVYFVSLTLWFGVLVYNRFIDSYKGGGGDIDAAGKLTNSILSALQGARK